MSECTDNKLGKLLYAYELGMLKESDRDTFEVHLLECPFCHEQVSQMADAADLLRRDQDVRGNVRDLDRLRQQQGHLKPARQKWQWRLLFQTGAVALVILVLLILNPWDFGFKWEDDVEAYERRLAVMNFDNHTDIEDSARTGETVANLLITDLSQSQYVQVVSSQRVFDASRFVGESNAGTPDIGYAIEVARKVRAIWLLTGAIIQVEPRYIVTAQLIDVSSGDIFSSHRVTAGENNSLFNLVDRLTMLVKDDLALPRAARWEDDPHIADITTSSPEAYRYLLEGLEYNSKLYIAEAKQAYERALDHDSTLAWAYYCLSWVSGDLSWIEKAVEYSDGLGQREKLFIQAREATYKGNASRAVQIMEEIVQRYPDEKVALMELGSGARTRGDSQRAIELLEKAVDVDPLYREAVNMLAYTYADVGDMDRSIEAANRYVEMAPDEPNPWDTKGEMLAIAGRVDEALEAYQMAHSIRRDFGMFSPASGMGRIHLYAGNLDSAKELFELIAVEGCITGRSKARTRLATIPIFQGKFQEALNKLDTGLVIDRLEKATVGENGDRAMKHYLRGRIQIETGHFDEGVEEIRTALKTVLDVYPENRISYRASLAVALAESGRFDEADEVLEKLRRHLDSTARGSSNYWAGLGGVQMVKGDTALAVASLEKVVAPEVANYHYRYLLARAYQATGRTDEAIAMFEKLLRDHGSRWRILCGIWSVKTHYHLARAYETAGRTDDAMAQYSIFLDKWKDADPELGSLIDDARNRLTTIKSAS